MKKLMLLSVILLGSQVCWVMSEEEKALKFMDCTQSSILQALAEGVDVNYSFADDVTALFICAAEGKALAVETLLAAGADVNRLYDGRTVLSYVKDFYAG